MAADEMYDQSKNKQHDENEKQDLSNVDCDGRNVAETEDRGNDRQ